MNSDTPDPRRWIALVFISLAQLMIALDATVMNIALPSAQHALRFTDADRQWVITAFTLAFGGLLLIGGRLSDRLGRRRSFLVGLAGFAAASAVGGAATDFAMLTAARALQGAFGALLAPTVLGLIATTFTAPKERAKAFAVFGAIAGGGGAVGLLLGGVLTQDLSWRWCLYINTAVALVTAVGGASFLTDHQYSRARGKLDLAGALLVTGGVLGLVFGASRAAQDGWTAATVLAPFAAGTALLSAFAARELRTPEPLLPPRLLRDRDRAGACLVVACAVAGLLGLFLFLTYELQVVLHYSPVRTGLAFLPLSAAVLLGSQAAGLLLPHTPPRLMIAPGLVAAAAGMAWLTRLTAAGDYLTGILPSELALGLGAGLVFVPAINTATRRVAPREAGIAAAIVNTAQQLGGSLGVALLNTVAAGATARSLASGAARTAALVHGYATAAAWATGIFLLGAAAAALLITARAPEADDRGAADTATRPTPAEGLPR